MVRLLSTTLSVALLLGAPAGGAQPQSTADRPTAVPCTIGQANAMSEIACELRQQLGAPAGILVVSAPAESDVPLRTPGKLEVQLASLVAGQLGGQAADDAVGLAIARGLAGEAGTLLHLKPTLRDGILRVEADVYPVPARFWDRVRDPRPHPVLHAFVQRQIDPEIRSYLPVVPLVAQRVIRAKSPVQDPLALACGDVDSDGSSELVLVGRRAIHLARVRGGQVVPSSTRSWASLAAISPTPLRDPIGSVAVVAGHHIDVGISDRTEAVRFDPKLEPQGKVGRRLPWPGGEGCSRIVGLVVGPQIHPCLDSDPEPPLATFGWGTDALASAQVLGLDGKNHHFYAGRIANSGEVVLRAQDGQTVKIPGSGAQVAVGDADGDGVPEIVTSANTLDPKEDHILVQSWRGGSDLKTRLRLDVPVGVRAVAICPPDSTTATLAVATNREVWIIR